MTQAQRDALAAETFKAVRDGEMAADCARKGLENDAARFTMFAVHSASIVMELSRLTDPAWDALRCGNDAPKGTV